MGFAVQEHLKPRRLKGFSDAQIEQHWAYYQGDVAHVSTLLDELARAQMGSHTWAELMRRAALAFNRMVLHEYYFGNLQAGVRLSPQSPLTEAVSKGWGSLEAWQKEFAQTGEMHGIGWAILYHDPATDRLLNWWASDDDPTHPIRLSPILVLDVFEHAYMVDYGAGGRSAYVAAFLENVQWEILERRLHDSKRGRIPRHGVR
jgi:Fe-Mn family superoxide dismutase